MLIGFLHRGGLEQWSYAILADLAAQGVDAMRFTSADVDWARRLIHAETWRQGQWQRGWTPFPQAVRNFEFKDDEQDTILNSLPYTLGRHLRKDEQLELLARLPGVRPFIPATLDYAGVAQVMRCLAHWSGVILKPARGRLGQGIAFIRAVDGGYEFEHEAQRITYDAAALPGVIASFIDDAGRSYVVQQFAATTGPEGRYFNIRIIVHKGADGDWHACGFGLSLLARLGSVVANREAGAVNVSLPAMLQRRFGAQASGVQQVVFSAAVQIARVLDDALAQQADELALDMAVDDHGAPWLHEVNWRGGFWALQEDVGLYRYGGANAVRIARRHQWGVDPVWARAVRELSKIRAAVAYPTSVTSYFDTKDRWVIHLTRRSDDAPHWLAQAWGAGLRTVWISALASFGAALQQVGQFNALLDEQVGAAHGLQVMVGVGYAVHNPTDARNPRRWLADEAVAPGLMTAREAQAGVSWASAFLRQQVAYAQQALGGGSLDTVWLQGLGLIGIDSADAWPRWLSAAQTLSALRQSQAVVHWGLVLSLADVRQHSERVAQWLQAAHAQGAAPDAIALELPPDMPAPAWADAQQQLETLSQSCAVAVLLLPQPRPPHAKAWDAPHRQLPAEALSTLLTPALATHWRVAVPLAHTPDWDDFSTFSGLHPMTELAPQPPRLNPAQQAAVQTFAAFDPRQLFRFFVDGRFHKKYKGWVGYEDNEAGSVKGILDAYTLMLTRFEAATPLNTGFIRDLHIACMAGVSTKNRKSTPGELRFLESGINLYNGKSTRASVQELLDARRGDGNIIFHHPDYQRPAEAFTADEILDILAREGRVRYRAWYPNLTPQQLQDLSQPASLSAFYAVKHFVQRCFAERTDAIVAAYNQEMSQAQTDAARLLAISRVVRDLELLHPFPDGNGRSFVAVLMNHLLLAHGFLPAILWDPNIDAELSVQEFADEIARGIDNTRVLLATPQAVLYDYSIDAMPADEVKAFSHLSQDFNRALAALAWGEPTAAGLDAPVRLALTPAQLAQVCSGRWMHVDAAWMQTQRFDTVTIEAAEAGAQTLLFCRQLVAWRERKRDPAAELALTFGKGLAAVVLDDANLAATLTQPVLLVADVDDALYAAALAVRATQPCKAVALLGTGQTAAARRLLLQAVGQRVAVQAQAQAAKTPQVMAALANLKRADELAVLEVVTGARPAVARHRLKAIAPSICWFCSAENVDQEPAEVYQEVIKTLATCAEALGDAGLCLVNADGPAADWLCEEIRQRASCAIQTYGSHSDDPGRLVSAAFDVRANAWSVQANILGQELAYTIGGDAQAPLLSVGALLLMANLGLDLREVCEQVWR